MSPSSKSFSLDLLTFDNSSADLYTFKQLQSVKQPVSRWEILESSVSAIRVTTLISSIIEKPAKYYYSHFIFYISINKNFPI